jgi:hypothetical protein
MSEPDAIDRAAAQRWVAQLLLAAWQRQEVEGRYRGADDFRALHIDPVDALASWSAAVAGDQPWPVELAAEFSALAWPLADRLGLTAAERLVALLAVAVEWDPRLRPLVAALSDDPMIREPTLALVLELAGAIGARAEQVRRAVDPDGRLASYQLVNAIGVDGRPSRLDVRLVADEWLIADGRLPLPVDLRITQGEIDQCADGHPVLVHGADHVRHAECVMRTAALLGPSAGEPDAVRLAAAARAARDVGAALVIARADAPSAALVAACEHLVRLGSAVALSIQLPIQWVAPAAWRRLDVRPLTASERGRRWTAGLADAHLHAERTAVDRVALDYALGADAVDDAITRLTSSADQPVSGDHQIDEAELRAAARRTAWRDLSSVAHPGPIGVGWSDLVVPPAVELRLREIAGAIGHRRAVFDDWGFGDRPGGRGYHVLFAGPSGTGKTLSAAVIACAVGLELWVVDLARIVDKYLGETEKQIDRVLRAAQSSGAMLLFDEADALFGRRAEVREARDRWANVEVAYLLQRIESHDGVTVLTTNVSHHLDAAFARRMSQRVEFPMPNATLRRQLWQRSMPIDAPIRDRADLDTVADRFELAGGAIRTAAVNAAFAAAGDGGRIGLRHVVRASVGELTKAGREPTRAELGDLFRLLEVPVGPR